MAICIKTNVCVRIFKCKERMSRIKISPPEFNFLTQALRLFFLGQEMDFSYDQARSMHSSFDFFFVSFYRSERKT